MFLPMLKKIAESNSLLERVAEDIVRWKILMPKMVDLEVSRVCNLKCPRCLRNAPSSLCLKENKLCSLQTVKDLLEEIPSIVTFNFMGDGEPTCNPEFQDIIKYIASKNINTIVTTNGTLLTEKIVKEWAENKIYRVHVSIDGATKETYERIRVGAIFEKTIENLKLLRKASIPVCVNMLLTEDNVNEMPEMVSLCAEAGVKEVTYLMPICTLGSDIGDGPFEFPKDRYWNQVIFGHTAWLCRQKGIHWTLPINLNPMFRRLSFPFTRPQISMEGDVYSCCYMIGRGKTWFGGHLVDIDSKDYVLGNMFQEGFRTIWYGDAMNELRTTIKKSERRRSTIITREELMKMRENLPDTRFKHCEACLPRWGMACS